MTDHVKGLLITTLGVLFILPDSLMVRLIATDGVTVAFWKALTTAAVIGLGVTVLDGPGAFGRVMRLGWQAWVYAGAVGASGAGFVIAVSLTSVANVVFIVAAMPVFAAIFSWAFLGERVGGRMLATMVAVGAGLAVIAYGSGETEGAHWSGDVLALAVAACFAGGLTAARSLRPASLVPAIPVGYGAAALVLVFFSAPLSVPADDWIWVALHGGVFIVGSTVFITMGPRWLPSAEVALLILLESVFAPLLAWAVVGEDPGRWAMIGGAIVIGALFVSNLAALTKRRPVAAGAPGPHG
ncbi:DMT family transporter [Sinisalibacter aestuarii]|nr:DMT family transporter [Sinisalibacter aestuarii]